MLATPVSKQKRRPTNRDSGSRKTTGSRFGRTYLEIDQDRARVLFAVLRLQQEAFQRRIALATGFSVYKVGRLLRELLDSGYLILAQLHEQSARKVYEVESTTTATGRDTAVMLLELLECAKDPEGKVNVGSFSQDLVDSGKLKYLRLEDLVGTLDDKGKIAELVEAGEYIERLSSEYVRPRLRISLENRYLRLLADEISLEGLKNYDFAV